MGSFLQVDIGVLRESVRALRDSGDHMDQALHSMEAAAENRQIGTDTLNNAVDYFQDKWQYGLNQLHSMITEISDGLNQTTEGYQQAEQAVIDSLDMVSGTLSPGE